ncbi:MAG: hypothetical protein ACQERB_11260 [Promethearchaeati archaeon]
MEENLTFASIIKIDDLNNVKFKELIKESLDLWSSKYLLIIKTKTINSLKLTFYPIQNEEIFKITIFEEKFTEKQINDIVGIIKDLNIIHASGLTSKGDKFFYECYLDLYKKNFDKALKNLKAITRNLKIEVIGLKTEKK